jgi:hypothetical protein
LIAQAGGEANSAVCKVKAPFASTTGVGFLMAIAEEKVTEDLSAAELSGFEWRGAVVADVWKNT